MKILYFTLYCLTLYSELIYKGIKTLELYRKLIKSEICFIYQYSLPKFGCFISFTDPREPKSIAPESKMLIAVTSLCIGTPYQLS